MFTRRCLPAWHIPPRTQSATYFGVARRQKIPPKSHGFHDSVDLLRSTGEQTTVPPTVPPCCSSCDATKRLNFSCSVDIQQAFSISPVNLVLVIRRKPQPLDDADCLTAVQTQCRFKRDVGAAPSVISPDRSETKQPVHLDHEPAVPQLRGAVRHQGVGLPVLGVDDKQLAPGRILPPQT